MQMTFGSLFAGIGGFDLGLERAGMKCLWQCERNKFCNKVLAKHWPEVPRYDDITTLDATALAPVDLICGGFPCQPFSVAGKRKGAEDDRFLWPAMLKVIQTVRPTWVLGENVPGLIRMELDTVLSNMENIGYSCQAFIVPACAKNAPHRRDRVWVIAHLDGVGCDPGDARKRGEFLCHGNRECQTAQQNGDKFQPWIIPDTPGNAMEELQMVGQGCENGEIQAQPRRVGRGAGATWGTDQHPLVGGHDGVSCWVDRVKALGNAVVPQVVEVFGRMIIEAHEFWGTT